MSFRIRFSNFKLRASALPFASQFSSFSTSTFKLRASSFTTSFFLSFFSSLFDFQALITIDFVVKWTTLINSQVCSRKIVNFRLQLMLPIQQVINKLARCSHLTVKNLMAWTISQNSFTNSVIKFRTTLEWARIALEWARKKHSIFKKNYLSFSRMKFDKKISQRNKKTI